MEINKLILELEEKIRNYPEGRLKITHSPCFQYYNVKGKKLHYIKKENQNLIKALAQKTYDIALVGKLKKKITDINELGLVFDRLGPERQKLVKPYFLSNKTYVKNWLMQKSRIMITEEIVGYKTDNGETVRSKSELLIANKLFAAGIPYIYEKPLILGDRTIYPDFTILVSSTRQEIIWEHFGMMGDPSYRKTTWLKLDTLSETGFVFGKNFIATFEETGCAFSISQVNRIVENLRKKCKEKG